MCPDYLCPVQTKKLEILLRQLEFWYLKYVGVLTNTSSCDDNIVILKSACFKRHTGSYMDKMICYQGFVSGWHGQGEVDRNSVETRLAMSQLLLKLGDK